MKKTTKLIVTGAMCAALAATSFAAGSLINIAVDPTIKILVNGEEFKPKDVNGKDVMVFVYEGTTYAPLRALAEAYGLEVGYDANLKMATVSEPGMSQTTVYDDTNYYTDTAVETIGMKNAAEKAKRYLESSAFSYEGLVEQLEYEGYTYDEAVYGVDRCGADWYEQAEKKAKRYLESSAFSYDGLVGQLEYEGYTYDEAVYGADNCGADWYEQAVAKAERYLELSSFSREGLKGQLEYEGFTEDQAEYALDQIGY